MRFYLSGNLMRFSDYERDIEVEGDTVHAGLTALFDRHPSLRPVLLDSDDDVRGVHQIFLDGEVLTPDYMQIKVSPNANVTILTALAGG